MTQPWSGPALPALFIGHGAPPLLDDALWMGQLKAWADSLPRPRAILVISAHWESAPVAISASAAGTGLIYDFGGFAQKFYEMTYETPDASELAALVASVMPDSMPLHQHTRRGLDHGAWVPLRAMYPNADIPVLQLSLPTLKPQELMALGERLRPLREQGVLIIASGFLTHGLPYLRDWSPAAKPPGWSVDFDLWAADAIDRADFDTLADFASKAPGMPYAHPTVEHLAPIFVALGAGSDSRAIPQTRIDGYFFGLAKRSIEVA